MRCRKITGFSPGGFHQLLHECWRSWRKSPGLKPRFMADLYHRTKVRCSHKTYVAHFGQRRLRIRAKLAAKQGGQAFDCLGSAVQATAHPGPMHSIHIAGEKLRVLFALQSQMRAVIAASHDY